MNIPFAKNAFALTALLGTLAGCALPHRSHTDVASPSNEEFIEFDRQVDVPLSLAYQNLLAAAPACWCSSLSGQMLAYSDPARQAAGQISFVVPGKLLGSKVELATIHLYPVDANRTRIIGTSYVYPGTWRLETLDDWANGAAAHSCTDITSS